MVNMGFPDLFFPAKLQNFMQYMKMILRLRKRVDRQVFKQVFRRGVRAGAGQAGQGVDNPGESPAGAWRREKGRAAVKKG